MTLPEQWRPIPGWEGLYDVSDRGRVRSLDHATIGKNGGHYRFRGRLLKATINPRERRRQVKLHRDGTGTTRTVGPLVLLAFVGSPPDGHECCHYDGDSLNDALANLRWDTHSANVLDSVRHGTHWKVKGRPRPAGSAVHLGVLAPAGRSVALGSTTPQ